MSNITELDYSAGLVSQSFWFPEMRTILKMILSGMDEKEIRQKCITENLFGMPNERRILEVYLRMKARSSRLDEPMMRLFMESDLATQKLINLVSILRGDRLFFEFINEVYREKVILGQTEIADMDINAFFTRKGAEEEFVENLSDATKRRLRGSYKNYLKDAGMITADGKKYFITVPIMDIVLERKLIADGEESIVKAITGRN